MTAQEALTLVREIKSLDDFSAAEVLLQVEIDAWKQGLNELEKIYKPVKEKS